MPFCSLNSNYANNLTATYNSSTIPFKFGIDSNGNYGYIKEGADTVTPFKKSYNPSLIYKYMYSVSGNISFNKTLTVSHDTVWVISFAISSKSEYSYFNLTINKNGAQIYTSTNDSNLTGQCKGKAISYELKSGDVIYISGSTTSHQYSMNGGTYYGLTVFEVY